MIAACIAALSLAIWIYLMFARGGFWRIKVDDEISNRPACPAKRVATIVPARNEAASVGPAILSLLKQNYFGSLQVFLVDDNSSDQTAEIAHRAAGETGCPERLTIVEAAPLPHGWTGKLWALTEGLKAAQSFSADYYWFTDADIVHQADNLTRLVARAESGGFDLVSLMVQLRCESFAERMLIPAFVFFFFKLYPPAWVARADKSTAAAAGGCILIRPRALTRIAGLAAIRNQLIDDCALARAVKSDGPIWLSSTSRASSLRAYDTFRKIGRMIARNAFTQLRHSAWLLCAVIIAMTITYIAPPLLLSFGPWARLLGLAAWILMTITYLPILRCYRLSPVWAPFLPIIATFYLGATIYSAAQYYAGQGGVWKGRIQDLAGN